MMTDRSQKKRESNQPDPLNLPNKMLRWHRLLLFWGGGILFLGVSGGVVAGWLFVQQRLTPLVERQLSNYLNRPVKLGSLQYFSFNQVRFGESKILTTPTDPAQASMAALAVDYNPFKLILEQKLEISVTAVKPDIYLEQGEQKNWILTEFDPANPRHSINLKSLRLKDADVVLVSRSTTGQQQPPVKLKELSSQTDFIKQNNSDRIKFEVDAQLEKGGEFNVSGIAKTQTHDVNLIVRGNRLWATEVGHLIALPLELQGGQFDTNLEVSLKQDQLPSLQGVATLHQVKTQVATLPHPLQTEGQLRFREREVKFEQVTTRLGSMTGVVDGSIDLQKGYALTVQTQPTAIADLVKTLKQKTPAVPLSGELQAQGQIIGGIYQPNLTLSVSTTKPTRIDRVDFRQINAQVQVNNNTLVVKDLKAIPTLGGTVTGQGKLPLNPSSQFQFDIQGENLPTTTLAHLYETPLPLDLGTSSAQVTLSGTANKPETLKGTGKANFQLAGGTLNAHNLTYEGGMWQGKIVASGVNLGEVNLPLSDTLRQGQLQGTFNISGNTKVPVEESFQATGTAQIALENGEITAQNLELSQGSWKTDLGVRGVKLKDLLADVPKQFNGTLNGTFNLAGQLDSQLADIQGKGQGSLALAGGQIHAHNLQLADGKWSTQVKTQNIAIKGLFAQIPDDLNGKLDSTLTLAGDLDFSLADLQGQGIARLSLPKGAIAAQKIIVDQGKFKTTLSSENVALKQLSPNLTGNLTGNLAVAGQLNKLSPESLQVQGELNFSQGLAQINRPLTTALSWNGQRLTLNQVTAPGLSAKGWADVNWALLGNNKDKIAGIKQFDLDVTAKGMDLKAFPLPLAKLPPELGYGGKVDFDGAIAGIPKAPTIEGELALINFKVGDLSFEPVLAGNLQGKAGEGVKLQLTGNHDQLHLDLDRQFQPVAFTLKQSQIAVQGIRQPEHFQVKAAQIPLGLLQKVAKTWDKNQKLLSPVLSQPMSGDLSGQFALNLETGAIAGQQVAIMNPAIGTIKGKQFTGNFNYAKGNLTLEDGQFQVNKSLYSLNGSFSPTPQGVHLRANVAIKQGNLQDVLETLQIFEIDDFKRGLKPPEYAKAADLYPTPPSPDSPLSEVGLPNGTLSDRLTHFAEVNAWLNKHNQQEKKANPLPELKELEGEFNGSLALKMTPKTGMQADFDLKGQNWQWGDFQLSQFTAQGNWQEGILTLEPLKLQLGNSLIGFSGRIGEQNQQGELQVVNLPLEAVSDLVSLPSPLDVGGRLNGNIILAGNLDNPQASGKLAINNPTLNNIALASTEGQFTYRRGQFDFVVNSILGRRTEPLTIKGTFPYQLPFAKVKPDSDRLALKFQAQNEGLTLLNILTKGQLALLGGEGAVQMDVSGRVDLKRGLPYELQANGVAQIKNGTIAVQVIPDAPLTNVQGKITFDLDRLNVEGLTGQFSGGQVAMSGSLPLLQGTPQPDPLTVQFDDLAFNFPKLYKGGVTGSLEVAGSALKPKIGGNVELFNGEILLKEGVEGISNQKGLLATTELDNLKLTLGEKIAITRLPILSFLATGSLTLNGTFDQPQPDGTITLETGLVNLFASQLRLAGGKDNTAQFFPHRGLDPYLNIKLFTSASETTRNTVTTDPLSTEIDEPFSANKDSLQTVRIQAQVKGFASQITNGIELTSQPSRSSQQIITLLGGGFLNTLGQGETTLGLANLAGTAVLGPVQGAIGEALGLNEFRIFPTPLINDKDRTNSSSSIGVAAEAGVDITNELSLSIQKIVNSDRPPELGIRYRINESTVLRGASNFSDDSRGSIQFEQRF